MTNALFNFAIFWGVWLLVPMVIDGLTYLIYVLGVWRASLRYRKVRQQAEEEFFLPLVTVIVPVHNGEQTLGACLASLRAQSYPQEQLQVLVVNNGSTDHSFDVFAAQQNFPFRGGIDWLEASEKGKVWALNTGIHMANGDIVVNVDCDTVLDSDAIFNVAKAFHREEDLAAATGAILVRSSNPELSPWKAMWAGCEAFEYLVAFNIGRQYQTATNSVFTLAGAFSAFRREILLETFLYDRQTVSEDTKMTLDVRKQVLARNLRIGCIANAIAYVEPTLSPSRLYAQRVRWQRGELEVAALRPDLSLDIKNLLRIKGLSLPRTLVIDHTLAFPRLVWTFLLPMLYFLGYPLPLVATATMGMYVFYAAVELLSMGTCYVVGNEELRPWLRARWYLCAVMPAYRFMLFWFRFGGFLSVLTDEPQWRVADPWEQTREAVKDLASRCQTLIRSTRSRVAGPSQNGEEPSPVRTNG